jgi:single-stranded-DNA-specific exonuclease
VGWNPGVVGIVAARLMDRFQKPVAVVGFDESGQGHGSVRGPVGARLHDALAASEDLLVRFGGHQAAAGLQVQACRLSALRERFEQVCAAQPTPPAPATEVFPLDPSDDLGQVMLDLERLEPCGKGNPAPRLAVDAEVRSAREVRGGHLKLDLALPSGQRLGGFGLSLGAEAVTLSGRVTLTGTLRRDTWRGGDAVELRVAQIVR